MSCPVKQMHPDIAWKTGQGSHTQSKESFNSKNATFSTSGLDDI